MAEEKKSKTAETSAKPALKAKKPAMKDEKAVVQTQKETVAIKEDPYKTVKFVLMTEKAVQLIERENKMVFVVDIKAEKDGVKKSVESMFGTPVVSVRTSIDQKRRKRAYVKFKNEGAAGDIAIKLGII
ncbi:MAG TPA: 50S ribosomal protein L23 [archaeon]|nr:50S ribosomal protein L23 [archaeon]